MEWVNLQNILAAVCALTAVVSVVLHILKSNKIDIQEITTMKVQIRYLQEEQKKIDHRLGNIETKIDELKTLIIQNLNS